MVYPPDPVMNRETLTQISDSLANPPAEPGEHCYVIMQDHGPEDGGWGPALVKLPWAAAPAVFVYTGRDEHTLGVIKGLVREIAEGSGKPTRLMRYSSPETIVGHD